MPVIIAWKIERSAKFEISVDRKNSTAERSEKSEISATRENSRFPLRAENERPSRAFAFAAGRSLVGQSTFALAHAPETEFGYRETDR